jgi:hypothetical protein
MQPQQLLDKQQAYPQRTGPLRPVTPCRARRLVRLYVVDPPNRQRPSLHHQGSR